MMSNTVDQKEFNVLNPIRCIIFVLLYVEAFLLCTWLLPTYYNFAGIMVLLFSLVAIYRSGLKTTIEDQVFDSIRIRKFGVEYCSGVFGESWQRPFNEFRVECQTHNWIATSYHVKLKHQVLANLTLLFTFSKQLADDKVNSLLKQSPLKKVRHAKSVD